MVAQIEQGARRSGARRVAERKAQRTLFDLVNCINQRIFVGLPLGPSSFPHILIADNLIRFPAHDEAWIGNTLKIAAGLALRGVIVYFTPAFLRSYAYFWIHFLSNTPRSHKLGALRAQLCLADLPPEGGSPSRQHPAGVRTAFTSPSSSFPGSPARP